MNDGFKQRLIGAIVLVCIALIVWPVIFSDPRPSLDRRSQIPAMPSFEKYTVPAAIRPDNIEPVAVATVEPAPVAVPVVKPVVKPIVPTTPKIAEQDKQPKQQPKQDRRGLPEAWVLQVASFAKTINAEELKQALQKKGYKAFTRKIVTKDSKATRVYIGPKFTKDAFSKDKRLIDKVFKVNSMVLRFDP